MQPSESRSSERKSSGRKQYGFLYVALQDLLQAWAFAQHILDQGWHFEPWETRPAVNLQQAAFTTALVVAHRWPFTDARNWPKLPQRLLSMSLEERLLYQRMDALRNAVCAHSDSEARVLHPFRPEPSHRRSRRTPQ